MDFVFRAGSDRLAATASAEEVELLKKLARLAHVSYDEALDAKLPDGLTLRATGRERAVWFMAQGLGSVFLVFRGTSEWKDLLANVQVSPDVYGKHRIPRRFRKPSQPESKPNT